MGLRRLGWRHSWMHIATRDFDPPSVKAIDFAFRGWTQLTTVNGCKGLDEIGKLAFLHVTTYESLISPAIGVAHSWQPWMVTRDLRRLGRAHLGIHILSWKFDLPRRQGNWEEGILGLHAVDNSDSWQGARGNWKEGIWQMHIAPTSRHTTQEGISMNKFDECGVLQWNPRVCVHAAGVDVELVGSWGSCRFFVNCCLPQCLDLIRPMKWQIQIHGKLERIPSISCKSMESYFDVINSKLDLYEHLKNAFMLLLLAIWKSKIS